MTKIPTKEELLKKLKSEREFVDVLKKAPENERKQILSAIDYIAGSMIDAFFYVAANPTENDKSEGLDKAMKTGDGIIKENDGSPINLKEQK